MKKETARMKAEKTMRQGITVPCESNNEAMQIVEYISEAITGQAYDYKKLLDIITCYQDNQIRYVIQYNLLGYMPCIGLLLDSNVSEDDENWYPAPFEEDYGTGHPCAFCYVLNLVADEQCSEFGDVFFSRRGDSYTVEH